MTVYLLCFTNDAGEHVLFSNHAGHYLGETDKPVDERRDEHQAGCGANLTAHASAAGITFVVARTWPGGRAEERRLKGRPKGSHELKQLCPNCHPMPRIDRWAGGTPAWARPAEPGRGPQHQQRQAATAFQPPAPAPPPVSRIDRYQHGVAAARRFLDGQAGRTPDQIAKVHEYITGPWHAQPRHTPAAAEEMRGYLETVTAHLAQQPAASQHPPPRPPVHAAAAATAQSGTRPPPEPAAPARQAEGTMVDDRDQAHEQDAAARTAGQLRELAGQLGRGEQAAQRLQARHTAEAPADVRARSRGPAAAQQRDRGHDTTMEIA